jgi:hypothetical protein
MAALSEADIHACTHPRQFPRFVLALVFCLALLPIFAAVAVFTTAVLLLPLLVFVVWLMRETLFAHYKGNAILVSELNYPRIHTLTEELKETLGVGRNVFVFVYEQGNFNAFLMRLFFRRAVFLNSEILETGVTDDEVRWLVGRFVGYLRAQRRAGPAGWLIRMTQLLGFTSLMTLPYDRAMVYTGDRLALAAIGGDISTAASAMQKLFVGRVLGYSVNPVGLVEQHRTIKGSIFGFWARLPTAFPHMTARYVDLLAFAKRRYPDQYARFDSANPGLAHDIEWLSSEYSSGADFAKGLAIYGALILLVLAALAFDVAVYGGLLRKLAPPAPQPTPDFINTLPAPAPDEGNQAIAPFALPPETNQADQPQTDTNESSGETPSPDQPPPDGQQPPPDQPPQSQEAAPQT